MLKKCSFVGIGVQKSASTWVHRVLEDHSQVLVSDPKELNFFSDNYEKGEEWYHSFFTGTPENKGLNVVSGEISPSYFPNEEAPLKAHQYNPNFKVIVTLRDPVERAYSNHLHLIRIGQYKYDDQSFEEGLKHDDMYLEQSKYYKHLSKWFSLFPEGNILVLLQEDIQRSPEIEAKKLYKFLGIDESHVSAFLNRRANVSYKAKNKSLEIFFKAIGSSMRLLGLVGLKNAIKNMGFVVRLRERNRVHLSSSIPDIREQTRIELMEELSGDVLCLASLLKRDNLPWRTWEYAKSRVDGTEVDTFNVS